MLLVLATLAVYAQVYHFDFVTFDDADCVTHNANVRLGLTPAGIAWAFTTGHTGNWVPLTWLTHMLAVQFFGLQAGFHHLISVFIHVLAALALFGFLIRATGARGPSAFAAFLFALHPLHVDSVAWIAERKDVLNGLFWFLTLWAYVRYSERPGLNRYLLILLPFCFGAMAKPMIVTLPCVLLLLDFWPLGRFSHYRWQKLVWEKMPLFALSALDAIITFAVQRQSGAVQSVSLYPIDVRIENAIVSYAHYLADMLYPVRLAVFYPYDTRFLGVEAVFAGLLLAGVSFFVFRLRRAYPYLAVGWLWFLGTLVPVIGLVQVGGQSHADRYMYIPMVGLTIMLAWGAKDLLRKSRRAKPVMIGLAAAACCASAALTAHQLQYWKNTESLFQHALDVTDGNYFAHDNLGIFLMNDPGRLPDAIAHFKAALAIAPGYSVTHNDLGAALLQAGRTEEAIAEFNTALKIRPNYAEAHYNLGLALSGVPGRLADAIEEYRTALRMNPDYIEAHFNLAMALSNVPGGLAEAITEYQAALRLKPDYIEARNNLANALAKMGRAEEAIREYEALLQMKPNLAEVHYNLGLALYKIPDRQPEAISHFETALKLNPNFFNPHYQLGMIYAAMPSRMSEAIAHLEAAQRIRPSPQLEETLQRLKAPKNLKVGRF